MKTRCHVGCSAYIKRAFPDFSDCIGRIVTVDAWLPAQSRWRVSFVGPVPMSVGSHRGTFVLADEHLIPIGGVPVEDEVTEDLQVTA